MNIARTNALLYLGCIGLQVATGVFGLAVTIVLVIAFIAVPPVDTCPWDALYLLTAFHMADAFVLRELPSGSSG